MHDRSGYYFASRSRTDDTPGGGGGMRDQVAKPGGKTTDTAGVIACIQRAVTRLIEVVDQETAALRNRTPIDHKEFNSRKAHGLLELDRALGLLGDHKPDDETLRMLSVLREKLELNRQVLAIHVQAVREVAAIIAETIREADSDGTYTRPLRGKE